MGLSTVVTGDLSPYRLLQQPTRVFRSAWQAGSSMWVIASSILLALIGVVVSLVGLGRLTDGDASRDPHTYWASGWSRCFPPG